MKLQDFPAIADAFTLIMADQPWPPHMQVRLLTDKAVPRKWQKRFEIAESVLNKLRGKTLKQVGITQADRKAEHFCKGEAKLTEYAFEHVVLPINEFNRRICTRAGIDSADAAVTDAVLYEFFDGDLREVFQSAPRR